MPTSDILPDVSSNFIFRRPHFNSEPANTALAGAVLSSNEATSTERQSFVVNVPIARVKTSASAGVFSRVSSSVGKVAKDDVFFSISRSDSRRRSNSSPSKRSSSHPQMARQRTFGPSHQTRRLRGLTLPVAQLESPMSLFPPRSWWRPWSKCFRRPRGDLGVPFTDDPSVLAATNATIAKSASTLLISGETARLPKIQSPLPTARRWDQERRRRPSRRRFGSSISPPRPSKFREAPPKMKARCPRCRRIVMPRDFDRERYRRQALWTLGLAESFMEREEDDEEENDSEDEVIGFDDDDPFARLDVHVMDSSSHVKDSSGHVMESKGLSMESQSNRIQTSNHVTNSSQAPGSRHVTEFLDSPAKWASVYGKRLPILDDKSVGVADSFVNNVSTTISPVSGCQPTRPSTYALLEDPTSWSSANQFPSSASHFRSAVATADGDPPPQVPRSPPLRPRSSVLSPAWGATHQSALPAWILNLCQDCWRRLVKVRSSRGPENSVRVFSATREGGHHSFGIDGERVAPEKGKHRSRAVRRVLQEKFEEDDEVETEAEHQDTDVLQRRRTFGDLEQKPAASDEDDFGRRTPSEKLFYLNESRPKGYDVAKEVASTSLLSVVGSRGNVAFVRGLGGRRVSGVNLGSGTTLYPGSGTTSDHFSTPWTISDATGFDSSDDANRGFKSARDALIGKESTATTKKEDVEDDDIQIDGVDRKGELRGAKSSERIEGRSKYNDEKPEDAPTSTGLSGERQFFYDSWARNPSSKKTMDLGSAGVVVVDGEEVEPGAEKIESKYAVKKVDRSSKNSAKKSSLISSESPTPPSKYKLESRSMNSPSTSGATLPLKAPTKPSTSSKHLSTTTDEVSRPSPKQVKDSEAITKPKELRPPEKNMQSAHMFKSMGSPKISLLPQAVVPEDRTMKVNQIQNLPQEKKEETSMSFLERLKSIGQKSKDDNVKGNQKDSEDNNNNNNSQGPPPSTERRVHFSTDAKSEYEEDSEEEDEEEEEEEEANDNEARTPKKRRQRRRNRDAFLVGSHDDPGAELRARRRKDAEDRKLAEAAVEAAALAEETAKREEEEEEKRREGERRSIWHAAALGLSRRACRFEIPIDVRSLASMSVRDFLLRHCVISSRRRHLYKKVFNVITNYSKDRLSIVELDAALRRLFVQGIEDREIKEVLRLSTLSIGAPGDNELKASKANEEISSSSTELDFPLFCAVAALAERLLCPRVAFATPTAWRSASAGPWRPGAASSATVSAFLTRDAVEVADFADLKGKLKGVEVRTELLALLVRIDEIG